ncbi:hypothetical protein CPC08DRAFT_148154 [Agrocybe pediades]|nr:hypothetical protein CPC08DRAFT_148154 [Agrocybe pediades]
MKSRTFSAIATRIASGTVCQADRTLLNLDVLPLYRYIFAFGRNTLKNFYASIFCCRPSSRIWKLCYEHSKILHRGLRILGSQWTRALCFPAKSPTHTVASSATSPLFCSCIRRFSPYFLCSFRPDNVRPSRLFRTDRQFRDERR